MQPISIARYAPPASLQLLTPVFKVFTAYENLPAYAQARKIQDQLKSLCRDEMEIVSASLKFPLFLHEESWRHAVTEAATADMIIIATSGADQLPFPVQSWISTWPRRDQAGEAALVTVLDSKPQPRVGDAPLADYFRRIATDRGLDFFCNQADWERSQAIAPRWETTFPQLINLPSNQIPFENWGIND